MVLSIPLGTLSGCIFHQPRLALRGCGMQGSTENFGNLIGMDRFNNGDNFFLEIPSDSRLTDVLTTVVDAVLPPIGGVDGAGNMNGSRQPGFGQAASNEFCRLAIRCRGFQ